MCSFSDLKGVDKTIHSCVWSEIQAAILRGGQANIFIILDCCHASCAVETLHSQTFEENQLAADALVASGIYSRSPIHHSLTTRLKDVLSNRHLKLWTKERLSTPFLSLQLAEQEKSIGYLCDLGSPASSESVELGRLFHLAPSRTISIHRFRLPAYSTGGQSGGKHRYERSSLQGTAYISVDAATNTDIENPICFSKTLCHQTGHRDNHNRDTAVNKENATSIINPPNPLRSEPSEGRLLHRKQTVIHPRHITRPLSLHAISAPLQTTTRKMDGDNRADQ